MVEDDHSSRYLRRFDATTEIRIGVGLYSVRRTLSWCMKAMNLVNSGGRRCLGRTSRGRTGVLEK